MRQGRSAGGKEPRSLGGRVSQLYKYFPKLCHPTCGLEINLKRLKANKRIRVLTLAEVSAIAGKAGDYTASIKIIAALRERKLHRLRRMRQSRRARRFRIRSTTT